VTRDEVRDVVLEALLSVAPDIDPGTLGAEQNLREQFELDSMDFLNFVIALHRRLGVDVPEADYSQLATVKGAVDYLTARLPG
jgi:acyl carrier protein